MNRKLVLGLALLAFCSVVSSIAAESADFDKTLAKGTTKLSEWVNSTNVLRSTSFYLFNVTEHGKKFTLAEVGPFRFEEDREIIPIGYEDHERILTFSMRKRYQYIDEGADLNQVITTLNTPLMLLYDAVDEYSNPIIPLYARLRQEVNKEILAKLPQFVNRTIEELLFGYSDETTRQIPRIREIFERYGVELKLTEYIRDGRFSVVTSRNGTSTGPMAIETGKIWFRDDFTTDLSLIGKLTLLRGLRKNPAWKDECSELEGTVPGVHRPNLGITTRVYDPELERPIKLNMVKPKTDDQRVRKFVWSELNFMDWYHHRSNICYQNTARWTTLNDKMGGTQRKSNHRYSTPTVWSYPHFYESESTGNFEKFEGLKPNHSLHRSYVEVDVESGTQVYERRNLQVNIDTSRATEIGSGILDREIFFPIYWFSDESRTVTAVPL